MFVFALLSTSRDCNRAGLVEFKTPGMVCYSISKGMFRNLIRPSSEHTFSTHVSLAPHSKSLHWSSVNKLQFALWYWEVKTSGNPPLWQHGLRQTMSSVLPHSPSITTAESTCLTVPLSLFLAGTGLHICHIFLRALLLLHPDELRPLFPLSLSLSPNSRTPEGQAGRERNLLISHGIWCHPGSINTFFFFFKLLLSKPVKHERAASEHRETGRINCRQRQSASKEM